ncbi:PAS domain S-box protein [Mucilaginibacter sp.]|uniref:PAS domain S-box protein n=1 Tax=Mucilaginibacter sp. TaxID=1882438 RepID=UPI00326666EE
MYLPLKLKAVAYTGLISVVIGFIVIIGWVFNILSFQTIIPAYASMKFNTALGFILLGCILLLTQFRVTRYNTALSVFLSILVMAIGLISMLQTLFHFTLGIDQFFITDHPSINLHRPNPGRMSVNTAACFILLGLAFVGFSFKHRFIHLFAQYLLTFVTAISAVALIGYLYGFSLFYNVNYAGAMAIHTALLFLVISITASLLHPEIGVTGLFTGTRVGNKAARRLLFQFVFIGVVFGAFRMESRHLKLFSFNGGLAVLIICFLCAGLALAWYLVNWLNALDHSRHQAEQEVAVINRELEKRVRERSAKLNNLLVKFRESESKFKAAFEHSAIGMALVSLKGRWLQVNKTLCNMVGYKEQELLSMSFLDIAHPDDHNEYTTLADDILKEENRTGRIERRYICKDGAVVWISVNVATVTDKRGGPVYFVSQFEDITERKNAEVSLKTAYCEIKKHMHNIENIAWKQSHLIRSPLANLKGLTTILLENPADGETLLYIKNELDRLDKVIIEMAEDAAGRGVKKIIARNRSFKR